MLHFVFKKDYIKSSDYIDKALELAPNFRYALLSKGFIFLEQRDLEKAEEIWRLEGNKPVMERHLARVDKLLTSPYLPADVKAKVKETRITAIDTSQRYAVTP